MTDTQARPLSAPSATSSSTSTGLGVAVALSTTIAVAAFLVLMSILLLVVHPDLSGLGRFAPLVNQQNQNAKTALYLLAFLVILPLSLLAAARLLRALADGPNRDGAGALTALLLAALAAALIIARVSRHLPWGDGLGVVLVVVGVWWLVAGAGVARAAARRPWPALGAVSSHAEWIWWLAGVLVFAVLLCLTSLHRLSAVALVIGAICLVAVLGLKRTGPRIPSASRLPGTAFDVLVIVLLILAIPDLIVYRSSSSLPNIYGGAGIIQYQHDYLLGSVNQLLGGGALLVNVPVSQYGVGAIYFIAGWFHVAPIGYGTFAALDAILTVLFYIAGYATLRLAGLGRAIAGLTMLVAVLAFIYNLQFPVGALPEQGPLRFGLPILVVLAGVCRERWRPAQLVALTALGISSVWALEALAYTAFTFIVVSAVQAWVGEGAGRLGAFGRRLLLGLGACVICHVVFAAATLAGSGHLPDWSQYLAYSRAFLLGGEAGAITYGFSSWSPGLAVGGATLASAAALCLVLWRLPALARRERGTLIGIAGTTAFEIALLSYTDNRSSTYLLPYVALPLLMAGALWLGLLLRSVSTHGLRRGALAFTVALGALLIAAAWSQIATHFNRSALARAYPGGGLSASLHRLWHPPPIDPRSPEGLRIVNRFMPGHRVLILLPTVPDLGTEILIRGRKANSMFIGDPKADSLVSSVWIPKLTDQVARLRSGQRLLVDRTAMQMLPALRRMSAAAIVEHPIEGGWQEIEWLLRQIDRRFQIAPRYRDADGLIVAELRSRPG